MQGNKDGRLKELEDTVKSRYGADWKVKRISVCSSPECKISGAYWGIFIVWIDEKTTATAQSNGNDPTNLYGIAFDNNERGHEILSEYHDSEA